MLSSYANDKSLRTLIGNDHYHNTLGYVILAKAAIKKG